MKDLFDMLRNNKVSNFSFRRISIREKRILTVTVKQSKNETGSKFGISRSMGSKV